MSEEAKKTCFVICPIGAAGSSERKRSDQVLKYVIRPAVEPAYEALRADQLPNPGVITTQILDHLIEDDLVIADLTDHNANVFYELAIRHAFHKPVIQIMSAGQQVPFDVSGMRTIFVNHQDLDSVNEAKAEIAKQLKRIEADRSDVQSPLTQVADIQQLRTGNPTERSNAEILTQLAEVRSDIAKLTILAVQPSIFTLQPQGELSIRYPSDPAQSPYLTQPLQLVTVSPRSRGLTLEQQLLAADQKIADTLRRIEQEPLAAQAEDEQLNPDS